MDLFSPEYNINPTAGSRLGAKHTEESREKLSIAKKGENHPNFGKSQSDHSQTKLSEAKMGEKNNFFGKTHTEESRKKISEAKKNIYDSTPKGGRSQPLASNVERKNECRARVRGITRPHNYVIWSIIIYFYFI